MEKREYEMDNFKRRKFRNSLWIPLYACQEFEYSSQIGYDGYRAEFFGCGALAIPVTGKGRMAKMGCDSIGIGYDSISWLDENGKYFASDFCTDLEDHFLGLRLVLRQEMESLEPTELFLHQDFVLALGLKREGDTWVRPTEGYIEVAHIKRDAEGVPICLEVRAEHLKDYLCAGKMALRIASYRERVTITSIKPEFTLDSVDTVDTREQIDNQWVDILMNTRWLGEGVICNGILLKLEQSVFTKLECTFYQESVI